MFKICLQTKMSKEKIKFVFLGSSRFSEIVLEELETAGYSPILKVTNAKDPLPNIPADFYLVASFGKIIPKEVLDIPKYGSLNVHPSHLPELRGPSPIQASILGLNEAGVTIIKMDEEMDHGPIVAQEKVEITPWPDHYAVVEEKLARAGGKLLVKVLENPIEAVPQDEAKATYIKLVKKEDGLLNLEDNPETNLRKILAYSTWPGAYFFFSAKVGGSANPEGGKTYQKRIIVKNAKVEDGKLILTRVIPEGKKEMDWQDFLRGNS
mgnify:CR=1 FL=1